MVVPDEGVFYLEVTVNKHCACFNRLYKDRDVLDIQHERVTVQKHSSKERRRERKHSSPCTERHEGEGAQLKRPKKQSVWQNTQQSESQKYKLSADRNEWKSRGSRYIIRTDIISTSCLSNQTSLEVWHKYITFCGQFMPLSYGRPADCLTDSAEHAFDPCLTPFMSLLPR